MTAHVKRLKRSRKDTPKINLTHLRVWPKAEDNKKWPMGQIQPPAIIVDKFTTTQSHSFVYILSMVAFLL